MVDVQTRTLRSYLATLPNGGTAGVVDQGLAIRNDLVTDLQAIPPGGSAGQVLAKDSSSDFDVSWVAAGAGDMQKSVYDPQNIEADAFARANQTGTQSYTTITGLGTAALANTADFATAGQGALATTAVQPNAVQTLTNKRITPRVSTAASTATLTPDANAHDVIAVSAQAAALSIAAPVGVPTDGQALIIRIRDNGTARAISWNAIYTAYTPTDLRTTTVVGKPFIFQFLYNSSTSNWELLHSNAAWGLWS